MPGTIVVRPDNPGNTHDLSFEINGIEFGVKLKRGAKSVNEIPATPSNILVKQTGKRFGDFDPANTHIEMRDWSGGRGEEFLVDDPSKFYDSQNLWSLTPGVVHQAPQWNISTGLRDADNYMPGSMAWRPLLGDEEVVSVAYTATASFSINRISMWLRRVGNPDTLILNHSDDTASSLPSTAAAEINSSIAITTGTVLDTVSEFVNFTFTTAFSQTNTSDFQISLTASTADNNANHWEVGYDAAFGVSGAAHTSPNTNPRSWTTQTWRPYFRVVDADINKKHHLFMLGEGGAAGQVFAVSRYRDSSADSSISKLTTIGSRLIWEAVTFNTSNGTTSGTGSSLTGVVEDIAVIDNVAFMARGTGNQIYRMTTNVGSSVASFDDTTEFAQRLATYNHPIDGPQLWRVTSGFFTVDHSTIVAFASTLDFKPSTAISVGDRRFGAVGLMEYDDKMYVRERDSLWVIKDEKATRLPIGLDSYVEEGAFPQMIAHDLFLFLGWDYSVERLYGKTITDVGLWRGAGVPTSRSGPVGAFESIIGNLYAAVDAGTTGHSGLFSWNQRGWHELFRAPTSGLQMQELMYQPVPSTSPRLWMSVGDDIFYLQMPRHTLNPLRDPDFNFQHESVLITPTIDMGVSQLPKLFSEVHVISKNLNSTGTEIRIDYQVDDEVGGSTWIPLGIMTRSPADSLTINRGGVKQLRLRLRMYTADNSVATEVYSIIVKGVARTPVKRQWNIRATIGDFQVNSQGMDDVDPDAFYDWIYAAAESLNPIYMRSRWHSMHGTYVYAEPPSVARTYATPSGEWGAILNLVLRER